MAGTLDVVNEILRNSNSTDLRYRFMMLRNHYYNKALVYRNDVITFRKLLTTYTNQEDIDFEHQRIEWYATRQVSLMSVVHEMDILLSNEQDESYYQYL